MTDLKALIAKQRAKAAEVVAESIDIVVGGEKVSLTVERVHPDTWDELVLANPRRTGSESDAEVGYDTKGVTLSYPRLLVDGDALSAGEVAELYSVLDSPWRNAIGIIIWNMNVNHALKEMRALGKASAGRKSR